MPDLKGLAYFAVVGVLAVMAMTFFAPVAAAYGLAWLLEPRVGPIVWEVQFWASFVWWLAWLAFFFTALVLPRI